MALSLLALLLSLALEPWLDGRSVLLFLAAVMVSTWYGGLGPGLLAIAVAALATVYFLLPPTASLQIANLNAAVGLVVFTLVALLVSLLNAHLHVAQQRADIARVQAEAARQRLALLLDVSTRLEGSLDYNTTVQRVAQLVVPALADWCEVHITVDERRGLRRFTATDGDPRKQQLARERQLAAALPGLAPLGVQTALGTGQSTLYPEFSPAFREGVAQDGANLALLRSLGFRSAMIVPLVAGDHILGAITLASTNASRSYAQAELDLAQEVARRAALSIDNARLYQEAREAVRVRDELFATVSHDLKNPLTVIRGQAQLLRRRLTNVTAPDQQPLDEGLARIEATSHTMVDLVHQLLDIARLQMGRSLELEREPTDLMELARQAVAEQQQASEYHRLRVEGTENVLVGDWDRARLQRVMHNLLDNALKYSPDGGDVSVTVKREESAAGAWAVLVVQDQGVGIPPDELQHVFEQFYRATNVTGRIGGTGIGLAGTQQIVQQHGGSVVVESQEGVGSTFTVRLPLDPSAEHLIARGATDGRLN